MFKEMNHLLMAIAIFTFAACFVVSSYKNFLSLTIESNQFTVELTVLTKKGWIWLMTLSAFQALAASTTVTALSWILVMLYMSM